MDDIYLPEEDDDLDSVPFEKVAMGSSQGSAHAPVATHPSGTSPSDHVRITFDRFVTLVANHAFLDVVERNKDEEVILSTNLLTDLANSRRFAPNPKPYLMVGAGIFAGIFLGYLFFQ